MSDLVVATVDRDGDDLLVTPRMGHLPELKTLGASWVAARGLWRLPASLMHLRALEETLGHQVDVTFDARDLVPDAILDDSRLLEFQRPAAGRLAAAPRGQIMVASPGLGKTVMAIIAADEVEPDDQVVVVAPSSLVRTWGRAIERWAQNPTFAIVKGKPDWDEVRAARWLITTWDTVALHQDWFVGNWPLWILDESVKAKSRNSTLSMAMRGGTRKGKKKADGTVTPAKRWANLRRGIGRVWLLSGSPTTRFQDDLWAQLNMVWPRAFPSYWRFAERYCVIEKNVWVPGYNTGTVKADRRDRSAVEDNADLIYVVNQEDVYDLPEYFFEAVDVDLTPRQARAYEEMSRDFVATLSSGRLRVADNVMDQLGQLQRITSYWDGESAKHDALVSLVGGGVYEAPHLVWTHWREGAEALTRRLDAAGLKVGHVYGGMSDKVVDQLIEGYKRGDIEALVLSLGVGKFGHQLANTRTVHWVDRTWNADDYFQAMRRVRRIGLEHRPVSVAYLAQTPIEDLITLNLEGKVESISRVTNARLKELLMGLGSDPKATPSLAGLGR